MIYLDNAATTKICGEALDALKTYYFDDYFNPSAVYGGAINVKLKIDEAREIVASAIYANPDNIFFTSGGTEGDNTAVFGTCQNKGKIICSACEHPAVYNCFNTLKNKGFDVTIIPCLSNGTIDEEAYKKVISENKVGFCSIMHVNNETGGINDIVKLSKMLKATSPDAIFHSDGVQAYMKVPVNLKNSDVDLYSFSSHKINGAKGVGAIYVKKPNKLSPLLFGGGQEKGVRSGTENTAGIIAFSKAVELWKKNRSMYLKNFTDYRDYIVDQLSSVPDISYNTELKVSSPHVLSLNIGKIKGEVLLHMLESEGIYIGRGSACSTKETAPRALKALNVSGEGTIRISFGLYNTFEEIQRFTKVLIDSVYSLREMMKGR